MTSKADELWEKYSAEFSSQCRLMTEEAFLSALHEYGAEVRAKAAGVAGRAALTYAATKDAHERNSSTAFEHRDFGFNMDIISHSQYCAAAILRMELP